MVQTFPHVQQTLNSSFQRAIQKTPFEVMFGIAMKKRSDVDIQTLIKEEMMHKFDEERENFRREAKEQILKMQEENRKTYSKHRKVAKMCNVGDYVAIKRTQFGTGQKLVPAFIGPYEVTKVGRFNRYNVKRV